MRDRGGRELGAQRIEIGGIEYVLEAQVPLIVKRLNLIGRERASEISHGPDDPTGQAAGRGATGGAPVQDRLRVD